MVRGRQHGRCEVHGNELGETKNGGATEGREPFLGETKGREKKEGMTECERVRESAALVCTEGKPLCTTDQGARSIKCCRVFFANSVWSSNSE